MNARDIAIRTILGEAMGEGTMGQAAVAHVLRNRAADPRWPSTIGDVALQPKQFSAWNAGAGGNDLVREYGPESDPYQKAGMVYDAVMAGKIPDPTGGATHYYSPAGMQALVNDGSQSNILPNWLQQENARRASAPVTIGGHVFTGQAGGERPAQLPTNAPTATPLFPGDTPSGLSGILAGLSTQAPVAPRPIPQAPPPEIAPAPAPMKLPPRRAAAAPYLNFFRNLS